MKYFVILICYITIADSKRNLRVFISIIFLLISHDSLCVSYKSWCVNYVNCSCKKIGACFKCIKIKSSHSLLSLYFRFQTTQSRQKCPRQRSVNQRQTSKAQPSSTANSRRSPWATTKANTWSSSSTHSICKQYNQLSPAYQILLPLIFTLIAPLFAQLKSFHSRTAPKSSAPLAVNWLPSPPTVSSVTSPGSTLHASRVVWARWTSHSLPTEPTTSRADTVSSRPMRESPSEACSSSMSTVLSVRSLSMICLLDDLLMRPSDYCRLFNSPISMEKVCFLSCFDRTSWLSVLL